MGQIAPPMLDFKWETTQYINQTSFRAPLPPDFCTILIIERNDDGTWRVGCGKPVGEFDDVSHAIQALLMTIQEKVTEGQIKRDSKIQTLVEEPWG